MTGAQQCIALLDHDEAAGFERAERLGGLPGAVRPPHLDAIEARGLAETDVKTRIVGGAVAVRRADHQRPGGSAERAPDYGAEGVAAVAVEDAQRARVAAPRRVVAE